MIKIDKNRGLANIPILLGIFVLAIVIPVTVKLVGESQDTRRSAEENCDGCRVIYCDDGVNPHKETCSKDGSCENTCDWSCCNNGSGNNDEHPSCNLTVNSSPIDVNSSTSYSISVVSPDEPGVVVDSATSTCGSLSGLSINCVPDGNGGGTCTGTGTFTAGEVAETCNISVRVSNDDGSAGCDANVVVEIPEPTITPKVNTPTPPPPTRISLPTNTNTPSPTLTVPTNTPSPEYRGCNAACNGTTVLCSGENICSWTGAYNLCRNPDCPSETDCLCPSTVTTPVPPSPTPIPPSPTPIPTMTCPVLSANCNGVDQIILRWNSVGGADRYRVYRDDVYQWWEANYNSYADNGISCGVSYSYDVKPVGADGTIMDCQQNIVKNCPCSTVVPTSTPALACTSLTFDPATGPYQVGDRIGLTCFGDNADRFEFRHSIMAVGATFASVQSVSGSASVDFKLATSGNYFFECRACRLSSCTAWQN